MRPMRRAFSRTPKPSDRRAAAVAKIGEQSLGRSDSKIALSFIRFEPRATEKRALAGGSERVDTRVIEALYALPSGAPVIVGQRVDVFIEASDRAAITAAAGGAR